MSKLLSIQGLTKKYDQQIAVNNVSFDIKKGEICGLVGENGAGKTTLLRMLSGLISPSSGNITKTKGYRMGALIESPALQPNLSAIDNLQYMALQLNLPNRKEVIRQTLQIVGLSDVNSKKKAKDFSLGMRQRLAIALAILDKPDFLILDEPINGLDPVGIKEMRAIILKLREQFDMTILISSHILSELEMVVDRHIIMHNGSIIKEMTKESLQKQLEKQIYLRTTNNSQMVDVLRDNLINYAIDEKYITLKDDGNIMTIIRLIVQHDIDVKEIFNKQITFEDFYLDLIQEGK